MPTLQLDDVDPDRITTVAVGRLLGSFTVGVRGQPIFVALGVVQDDGRVCIVGPTCTACGTLPPKGHGKYCVRCVRDHNKSNQRRVARRKVAPCSTASSSTRS